MASDWSLGMKRNSNFKLLSWAKQWTALECWRPFSLWSNKMPNSKRRKRLVASNKKQIERARRRIEAKNRAEADKENATSDTAFLNECGSSKTSSDSFEEEPHRRTDQLEASDIYESTTGWLGGLYSWCHSGIVQVGTHIHWPRLGGMNNPLPTYSWPAIW